MTTRWKHSIQERIECKLRHPRPDHVSQDNSHASWTHALHSCTQSHSVLNVITRQKDFLGPLFKKLGNHLSFYEWNLGSNRVQKWRKLVLTSFRSLRELRANFPFISVAERQRLKLGMLEEKETNCSRRLWRKITCGDVKSVPKIFGRSQQR